jgi:zinc metalloproteinase
MDIEREQSDSQSIKNCGFSQNYIQSITNNFDINTPDFEQKSSVFQSYYNNKVELELRYCSDTFYLETKYKDKHIKLIDVNQHDLNINCNYSIPNYLLQLESPKYTGKSYNIDLIFAIVQYFEFLEYMNIEFKIPVVIALCNVTSLENAFFQGQYLVFGNGFQNQSSELLSPRMIRPLTSSAIVGHEMSHALIQYTRPLDYKGHSGALNESYSDILGICLEEYIMNKYQTIGWEIGSELYESHALRSIEDPHRYRQPKKMFDKYYIDPKSMIDYGGVHINSGIPNHCFYKICQLMTKKEALKLFMNVLYKLEKDSDFHHFKKILLEQDISDELKKIVNEAIF